MVQNIPKQNFEMFGIRAPTVFETNKIPSPSKIFCRWPVHFIVILYLSTHLKIIEVQGIWFKQDYVNLIIYLRCQVLLGES